MWAVCDLGEGGGGDGCVWEYGWLKQSRCMHDIEEIKKAHSNSLTHTGGERENTTPQKNSHLLMDERTMVSECL